jgi:hypothetical protein
VAAKVDEIVDEPIDPSSRVTPLVPVPEWHHIEDDRQSEPPALTPSDTAEQTFWETPPRYSQTTSASFAPPPAAAPAAPSPWRTLAARGLFAMIFCAAVLLLGFEIKALVQQEDDSPAVGEQSTERAERETAAR